MTHDGVVLPHPPVLRALNLAKTKLEASKEADVVEYAPYHHKEGVHILSSLFLDDGGETIRQYLNDGGEALSEWAISPPYAKKRNATQTWEVHYERDSFRHAYLQYWRGRNIDVLLSPAYPGVAPRHDTARYWGYTGIWNLLDWPGAVFPTGLVVDPAIDLINANLGSLSPEDSYYRKQYEPKVYVDAPISLQIVAPRFNDGLVLVALNVVERIVNA